MAGKFSKILGALGLGSDKEAVTEAHLEAADTKIAQLEQAQKDAELKTEQAEAALKTASENLTKAGTELKAEQEKVSTLEKWKQEQKATDQREEDDSNNLDSDDEDPKASWEVAAASQIAGVKKRLGEK